MSLEYINLLLAVALFVLIWTIQLLHYPTFKYIEPIKFKDFHSFHTNKITYIVAPLMVAELAVALALLIKTTDVLVTINLILVILTWVLTFGISVPIHNRLSMDGYDKGTIKKLCDTNWYRTVVWSSRLLVAIYYCQS